jgi:hypothetical protein
MNKYPWIRLYREALHDPKIVTLSDRHYRAYINCLLIADDVGGQLPRMRDIAVHLRMSLAEAEQLVRELVDLELIDVLLVSATRPSVYVMHGWENRQQPSDNAAERMRNYRARKKAERNALRNANSNACETVTVQNKKQKEDIYNKPSSLDAESEDFKNLNSAVVVAAAARRAVCRKLGIGNADPLVAAFVDWPGSRVVENGQPVINPSGKFIRWAPGAYERATADVRAACQPLDVDPEPLPPVRPSSSLLNSKLVKGPRRGR